MFIVSPRIGLCNQLQTIVKGILLGIKYNRNVYIDKFQIDLHNGRLCNINHILDINKINIFLKNTIKTHIEILDKIDENIIDNLNNYCLPNIDYNEISRMSFINDNIESNQTMKIIYLGNIVSLDIYQSFNYVYGEYSNNNLYFLIIINLRFSEVFYRIKDNIKEKLKLTNFNCVHLRIEDDALDHFSKCYNLSLEDYNTKLLKYYNDNMNLIDKDKKTYICSGMLQFDNKINFDYYNNLIKNNMFCDKKNLILSEHYRNNRELVSIVDLLIAIDSDYFIGCEISSFSQVIKHYYEYNKKKYILFNNQ